MVRIPYESRAIHSPKQSQQKASSCQKNGARVVSHSGERCVRIAEVEGSIPFESTNLRKITAEIGGDFSFDHRNTTDGFPV